MCLQTRRIPTQRPFKTPTSCRAKFFTRVETKASLRWSRLHHDSYQPLVPSPDRNFRVKGRWNKVFRAKPLATWAPRQHRNGFTRITMRLIICWQRANQQITLYLRQAIDRSHKYFQLLIQEDRVHGHQRPIRRENTECRLFLKALTVSKDSIDVLCLFG